MNFSFHENYEESRQFFSYVIINLSLICDINKMNLFYSIGLFYYTANMMKLSAKCIDSIGGSVNGRWEKTFPIQVLYPLDTFWSIFRSAHYFTPKTISLRTFFLGIKGRPPIAPRSRSHHAPAHRSSISTRRINFASPISANDLRFSGRHDVVILADHAFPNRSLRSERPPGARRLTDGELGGRIASDGAESAGEGSFFYRRG